MQRTIVLLTLALLCPGCGGGDTYQSLADSTIAAMRDMVATFDTVKDETSAKAAKAKLKSIFEQMQSLNERQAKLPAPTEADVKAIDAKYGKELTDLQMKLAGHMMRINLDPKIRLELADLEQSMQKTAK